MSTGKLNKSQPIVGFLAPSNADATTFGEPTKSTFDNPATSRVTQFAGDGALFKDGFITSTPMFDVRSILLLLNHFVDIIVIIAFIGAKMLLDLIGVRPLDNNRQVDRRISKAGYLSSLECGACEQCACPESDL